MNKLGVKTLREVQDIIRTRPEEFDINYFTMNQYSCGYSSEYSCDTVHCIGGWCQNILNIKHSSQILAKMGISRSEWDRLCYPILDGNIIWPKDLIGPTRSTGMWNVTPEQAIERIDRFIDSNGAI